MTILQGGLVLDGLGNAPQQADVILRGSRIEAVLERSGASIGPTIDAGSATVIDVSGLTLMPGLIDAHCHISFDEPSSNDELFFHRTREGLAAIIAAQNVQKLLRAGVTGFLDADCLFEVGVDLRDAIEAGIVSGPRMSTGGNALMTAAGGTAGRLIPDQGRIGYGKVVNSRDEIVTEVRRQIKQGVDWVKVHVTGLTPRSRVVGEQQVWHFDELKLVVDTAHDLGAKVVGHCRGSSSIADAARAGFDMILHATFMDDVALDAVASRGIPIVPTFTFQANLADFGHQIGASAVLIDNFRREIDDSVAMLNKARAAGVPLICGTESGFSMTPYGQWHYREMEVFVKALGFSALDAIRAGTSEAARALGLYGQTGAIAPNYMADIIAVNGAVHEDLTCLALNSNIKQVLLGGKSVDLSPLPARTDPPGWRVSHYGHKILRQQDVR